MKSLSVLLIAVAAFAIGLGFSLDTTVSTGTGRVHNIGLMSQQQNLIIFGGSLLVAGVLALALSGRSRSSSTSSETGRRKCPNCAELVLNEARSCRYCQHTLTPLSEIVEQTEAERDAERKRMADLRQRDPEAARLAEEMLPQGICPNCDSEIPLISTDCKHCKAVFGPQSAWSVLPKR